MTLILSTKCKKGICVCADKRNIKNGQPTVVSDNLNKIYKFNEIPLIIYNHGVNNFNNKMWNEYCIEYEKSDRWNNLNFHEICEDFRKFIEKDINEQLEQNFNNRLVGSYLNSAFVFCGKSNRNTTLKIYELYWLYGASIKRSKLGNLVRSRMGDKYLKEFFENNPTRNTNESWDKTDCIQAKKELKRIFLNAVVKKNRLGGDEFSNDYDIECIFDI